MPRLGHRILDRLGFRMALSLAVILLPLAIVSILRSQAVISQTEARNEAALFGETVLVASAELTLIDEARGVARSVAAVINQLLEDPVLCAAALDRIAERASLSFVGYTRRDGSVPCSNIDRPLNFAESPILEAALADPREVVRRSEDGQASQAAVIFVMTPVFSGPGDVSGFVVASIPHQMMLDRRETEVSGTEFLTVNADGEVLTSSLPIERAGLALPSAGIPKRFMTEGGTFQAMSGDGTNTIYAISPVVSDEIVMVGLWSEDDIGSSLFYLEQAALFPLLMWLASLVVGFLVVEFFVNRHVKSLVGAMRRFAADRQTGMPASFAAAPIELRDMGDAYVEMTETLVRDEATLEDAVHQKNILLREVHHRTKNNLQLISSIMSMQLRRVATDEAKEIIRGLQDRVLALATIHKGLYQTSGLASIKLDELLRDIVRQMQGLTPYARTTDIKITSDPVTLLPDQAVPLSLLVTEALTNAFKYVSAPAGRSPHLAIRLTDQGGDRVCLQIMNTFDAGYVAEAKSTQSTGLGSQLMTAFATQLGADMQAEVADGLYTLNIAFSIAKPSVDGVEDEAAATP